MTVETPAHPMTHQYAREQIDAGALADVHTLADAYTLGYAAGYARSSEEAGDAYGEGYAAGVAALAGRNRAWVAARRRLDALRPGDVILGKGDRWWIVQTSSTRGQRAAVTAVGVTADDPAEQVTVSGDASRLVDVVEPIATADALDALRGTASVARAEGVEV